MTEQLEIGGIPVVANPNMPPGTAAVLTARQRLAFDYVRERDGVTVDEVGAWLHSHKERRPHGVDERCDWCARDGRSVLISKALKPLVTYRRAPGGFLYVARNPADRARTSDESGVIATSEPDAALNPFADLSQGSNPAQEAAGE